MYNLYSNNYSKTSGSLWQYCKEIPFVNRNSNIVATDTLNFKTKITGQNNDDGRIDNVEIMVPLEYLKLLKYL